jgi:protein-S-isoprenylcysteine O-methyltransferase Ste14
MYAGAVLVLAGYALVWSNWTLALLVGVIARVYFSAKARAEERWLRERFRTYQSYMAHVSRRLL